MKSALFKKKGKEKFSPKGTTDVIQSTNNIASSSASLDGADAPGGKVRGGKKTNEILKNMRADDAAGKKDKKKEKAKAPSSERGGPGGSAAAAAAAAAAAGGEKVRPSYRIADKVEEDSSKAGSKVAGDDQSVMTGLDGASGHPVAESSASVSTNATNMGGGGGGGEKSTVITASGSINASASASAVKASHIASSAGTHRLNRILRNTNVNAELKAMNQQGTQGRLLSAIDEKAQNVKLERVSNPNKVPIVADFAAKVVIPHLKVDPRSIGGMSFGEAAGNTSGYPASMQQETLLCFKCRSFESTGTEVVALSALEHPADYAKHKRSLGLFSGIGTAKGRNKLRYVIIARSTNHPLIASKKIIQDQNNNNANTVDNNDADGENKEDSQNNIGYDTMFSDVDPNDNNNKPSDDTDSSDLDDSVRGGDRDKDQNKQNNADSNNNNDTNDINTQTNNNNKNNMEDEDEEEVSSFPVLICMTFHSDGTSPDIRKLIQLDKLTTVQDLQGSLVQLVFSTGDTVRLDFGEPDKSSRRHQKNQATKVFGSVKGGGSSTLQKEKFIWCLLQIHAMLCVSVVERTSLGAANHSINLKDGGLLPPLNVRNIDRAELQYLATVNRFVLEFDMIRILLNRQRQLADLIEGVTNAGNDPSSGNNGQGGPGSGGLLPGENFIIGGGSSLSIGISNDPLHPSNFANKSMKSMNEAAKVALEEMDKMAYDLMMGNFATRVAIFQNEAERKDAEEILNSTEWTVSLKFEDNKKMYSQISAMTKDQQDTAAATAAERLSLVLQKRMRDLEAETCRRLIAWEDEKHYSSIGQKSPSHTTVNDSVDALSLASLFTTLDSLDKELQRMESWLQERAAAIKPMTDDCRDIEEENRQLEQQWKSFDMLGGEMRRLLHGLAVGDKVEKVLNNPASALVYKSDGSIDVDESEEGVDQIHDAGKALQQAMQHAYKSGGLHLKAVRERADALEGAATSFCTALAQIIVTVMEQFKTEVVAGSDHGKVSKSDTHTMIAKKIRDTQRKFQSALLGYIKLIEILAELSPELLPAVRDAYSEMVAEGIMMKKRMKGYFQALPGKNASYLNDVSRDLRDYVPFDQVKEDTVHAEDIRYALSELLPVIAREAYFTAALFGLSNKAQDGRDKKRNFEAAKKSVDHSSQYFNYYIQRTCGIIQDFEPDNNNNNNNQGHQGNPMLCLVASIHLNEAMVNYIDREKKGGDHSLSLAYVRATILELRKKVDKQWVAWIDKQIEWIRSHPGVPANGKRAGIIPSYARFPCYLDHILLCCREGRNAVDGRPVPDFEYTPDLANIKVVSYYLQKMATALLESLRECCERETTDQQYAANVMSMENTYYFTQSIKQRGNEISLLFKKQITKANTTCKQSTDAYLGWMIKREFTSLHELFSRISKARRDVGDKNVQSQIPKNTFVRTLVKESSRDVLKEKISVLYNRMSKHLSEQGGLLPVAWKALVKVLYEWFGRWEKLAQQCYQHKLDPSAVDVVRIAKAAGSSYNKDKDKDKDAAGAAAAAGATPGAPGAFAGAGTPGAPGGAAGGGTGITAGVAGIHSSAVPGVQSVSALHQRNTFKPSFGGPGGAVGGGGGGGGPGGGTPGGGSGNANAYMN